MYRDDRHKLVSYHGLDYGELYDLEQDPLELTNLWEAPAAAALRASLTQKSFDATVAACDPGPRPNRPILNPADRADRPTRLNRVAGNSRAGPSGGPRSSKKAHSASTSPSAAPASAISIGWRSYGVYRV